MVDIFVVGCGGHAKVIAEIIEAAGTWTIAGYVETAPTGASFRDREILDESSFLRRHRGAAVVLAIGENATRNKLHGSYRDDFTLPTIVHPTALISPSSSLGDGTVIMAGAIVNADAEVGTHCVINSGAVVEHDCVVGDFASIGPGACICGSSRIAEGAYVGANATVIQDIKVGQWSVVGAGGVVCQDVAASTIVAGVPARPQRSIRDGESIL